MSSQSFRPLGGRISLSKPAIPVSAPPPNQEMNGQSHGPKDQSDLGYW
jgi:hypothetical protein